MAIFTAKRGELLEEVEVEVSVGNLKLLTSGTVYSIGAKPVNILFDDITINFYFEVDESNHQSTFVPKRLNDKEVDFILTNFNSPFGQGNIEPFSLLFIDHFDIYMSFFVQKIGKQSQDYQLNYSFFYGEKK